MLFTIAMGSVNTVYNAKVIKEISLPIAIQNTILYSFGMVTNLIFYFCSKTSNDNHNQHFFYGYNNPGVILLLILNSFVGIAITVIYKYGDAILKTLTGPLSSAILVYLSYMFFDMSLDIVKAAGAAVVVVDTLLYLSLPPPKTDSSVEDSSNDPSRRKSTASKLKMRVILIFFVLFGFQSTTIPNTGFFIQQHTPESVVSHKTNTLTETNHNDTSVVNSLPIVLIIQALKMEDPGLNANDPKAIQINQEKLRIFETYRPYFRHVIIDSPLYPGKKDACGDPAFEGLGFDCRYCSYTRTLQGNFDEYRFACAGEIFQDLEVLGEVDDVVGALVMHADFYLLPAFIQKTAEKLMKYQDSFWLASTGPPQDPPGRLMPAFTNDTVPKTDWHWPRYWERVERFREDLARFLGRDDRILVPSAPGVWSDIYYTPKTYWQHFVPFARIALKHKIMNEITIPLIHFMIAEMYDLDRGIPQNCLGGCCGAPLKDHLKSPELMNEVPCGHKIDLSSSSSRHALLDVWQQHLPSVSFLVNTTLAANESSQ
jgi:hypothetical protein